MCWKQTIPCYCRQYLQLDAFVVRTIYKDLFFRVLIQDHLSKWLLCCSFLQAGRGVLPWHWPFFGPAYASSPCLVSPSPYHLGDNHKFLWLPVLGVIRCSDWLLGRHSKDTWMIHRWHADIMAMTHGHHIDDPLMSRWGHATVTDIRVLLGRAVPVLLCQDNTWHWALLQLKGDKMPSYWTMEVLNLEAICFYLLLEDVVLCYLLLQLWHSRSIFPRIQVFLQETQWSIYLSSVKDFSVVLQETSENGFKSRQGHNN